MEGEGRRIETDDLRAWARAGLLTAAGYERALALAGRKPTRSLWLRTLEYTALILGIGFCVAGVIFGIAFNWATLPALTKLLVIGSGIVLPAVVSLIPALDARIRSALMVVAAVMVGGWLALFGQIYQTGADAYTLFLLWFVLISGWVLLVNTVGLWLLWVTLGNLSLAMYWDQMTSLEPLLLVNLLALLNTLVAAAWYRLHQNPGLLDRLAGQLLALVPLILLSGGAIEVIIQGLDASLLRGVTVVAYLVLLATGIYLFRWRDLDRFLLAGMLCSAILVGTTWIAQLLDVNDDSAWAFLLLGLLVVAQAVAGVQWLRSIPAEEARS